MWRLKRASGIQYGRVAFITRPFCIFTRAYGGCDDGMPNFRNKMICFHTTALHFHTAVSHFHTGVWRSRRACGINTNRISSGLNSIVIELFGMFSLYASLCRNCYVATAEFSLYAGYQIKLVRCTLRVRVPLGAAKRMSLESDRPNCCPIYHRSLLHGIT